MKKVLFLVNPISGRLTGTKIKNRLFTELQSMLAPDRFNIQFTEEEIPEQLKDVSPIYDTVVVVGGNGTISQVVQAVAHLEHKPKIGIIPIGTGNDLARSLGILRAYNSGSLKAWLKIIAHSKTRHVDIIGLENKTTFTNYFGIGIDAKIVNDFNGLRAKTLFRNVCSCFLGNALYFALGIKNIFYRFPYKMQLKYKSRESRDVLLTIPTGICEVLVTNITSYAGGALLSSKSRIDDGRFEVTVVSSKWQWLIMHCTRFIKKPLNFLCPKLIQFQTDRMEILINGDFCCQVDGETFNTFTQEGKNLVVSVESTLEMIVP